MIKEKVREKFFFVNKDYLAKQPLTFKSLRKRKKRKKYIYSNDALPGTGPLSNVNCLQKYRFLLQKGYFPLCFLSFSFVVSQNNQLKIIIMPKKNVQGVGHILLPFT